MGRKKSSSTETGTPAISGEAKPSLSQLIRDTLDAGIESPSEIVRTIKEKHDIEVKSGLVSMVKNKWKKDKGGKPAAKRGRKPATPAIPQSNGHVSTGGVTIEDLILLKGLVAKHGADGVGKLLEVIG